MTQVTGPNGATSLASYDAYLRPASKTAANGRVTTFTYGADWTLATSGTQWTKSYVDGFGRTKMAESGYNNWATPVTVTVAEALYAPCACSPLGKVWKTSLPYAPGGTVYWTEHLYDALGRTVQVKQPNSSGTTTYTYTGIHVTVTDPAGKWKKFENDAAGNLVKVFEPRPGGGTDYESVYTYSELGQLLTVTMARPGLGAGNPSTVTQTRTWTYNANQHVQPVNHPESGTTSFTSNGDGRVTAPRRCGNASDSSEDLCGRVSVYYHSHSFDGSFTQNAAGRARAVQQPPLIILDGRCS